MGLRDIFRQAFFVDCEAMVHGDDFDFAGGEVLNGVIGAMMALRHFFGLCSCGQR